MAEKEPEQQILFKQKIPKMPDGYYSGDKPNPNLRSFVEEHVAEHPYVLGSDDYFLTALMHEIEVKRSEPVYEMHSYWSKKPPSAIDFYIRHYTSQGDLVLDPFCGSGTTLVSALRLGRKAIGIDLSPAATFISSGYVYPFPPEKVDKAFGHFIEVLQDKCGYLYKTKDPRGGNAEINYIRWSVRLECPRCLDTVTVYDARNAAEAVGLSKQVICPSCAQRSVHEVLSTRKGKLPPIPVEIQVRSMTDKGKYLIKYGANPRDVEIQDMALRLRSEITRGNVSIPRRTMTLRLGANGYKNARDAIWPRAAVVLDTALGLIDNWTDGVEGHYLKFLISSVLVNLSVMYSDRDRGGQPSLGRLSPTPIAREINAIRAFERKHKRMLRGLAAKPVKAPCVLSTQSATDFSEIHSGSVDYVFTDPPYGDKIDFWELNLLWEAWLGLNSDWSDQEIVINNRRGKNGDIWFADMQRAFQEIFRVLKPGRWLSLCYHDTSEGTWEDVKDIASEVGFIPDEAGSAVTIGTAESRIHIAKREGIIKRDIVVNPTLRTCLSSS